MPAQVDNPDGFWEHLGFVALNEELVNALGGAWHLPPKLRRTVDSRGESAAGGKISGETTNQLTHGSYKATRRWRGLSSE